MLGGLGPLDDDDATGVAWRDVVLNTLAGVVMMMVLILPFVNPPGIESKAEDDPKGAIMVEVTWPVEKACDVDLWVEAPGEVPIGYSNKTGPTFALLRDDLGRLGDPSNENRETMFGRGVPVGEYTINVHLYRCVANYLKVPVHLTASVNIKGTLRGLVEAAAELSREGEELTMIRFRLDADANVVSGSVHHLQKDLRSSKRP